MKKILIIRIALVTFILAIKSNVLFSQKDSLLNIPFFKTSYGITIPGSELAQRFGNGSSIEMGFSYKTNKNWVIGITGNFLWGNNVKEYSILTDLYSSGAGVIGLEGELTPITTEQRGWAGYLEGGYQLPWLKVNKNSGFVTTIGIGFLTHKIRFSYRNAAIPFFDDKENLKGYDRKSLGVATKGFVGYYYFSKNRFVNFFGGVEYTYARVKNIRKYNYDTRSYDLGTHENTILSFRLGWILLLNKRPASEFYYY